jgi:alkanesulfonate monooxygenase SsuD/methylene tetrahydromethanopterin reductase-like flavin-dependent oxidoreductase (luciferase family)
VVAAGYREAEFAMFGRRLAERPARMRAGVEALRRVWTGEPFEYEGETVRVTPRPRQSPGPPLLLGGSSEVTARRAAHLGDGFFPGAGDPGLRDAYRDECAKLGRTPRIEFLAGPIFLHVSREPDADWQRIAPHALHEANSYGRWMHEAGVSGPYAPLSDAESLRASGLYAVLTPEACVERITSLEQGGTIVLSPLMSGLDPALGWESLQLFAEEVAPSLSTPGRAKA